MRTEEIRWGTGIGFLDDLDALAGVKVVSLVARLAASVSLVESSAERIRLDTNSVAEEGSLGTLKTDGTIPPGAEKVRRSRVINSNLGKSAVSTIPDVSLVA